MQQYHDLLEQTLKDGEISKDRTGVGTLSVFGSQLRFNLARGFPLVTTKRLYIRAIVHELLWFLKGGTNTKYLNDNKVSIWDAWADEGGDLGRVYGAQWRGWVGADGRKHDQITNVIKEIKLNPQSRRLIVSAWNVGELDQMALQPCHAMFQFYVRNGKLSCQLYQRSADLFLGVPFNIASYSLLTHMIALECDLQVGDFIWTGGDIHIYLNHVEQVKIQLARPHRKLPKLFIQQKPIFDYTGNEFEFSDYNPHPAIKATIAV